MKIHYLSRGMNEAERNEHPPVSIALGYFDGVHQGHRKVIQTAADEAERLGVDSAVLTFHPHPKTVLGQEPLKEYAEITPMDEKIEAIRQLGVNHLFIVTFDTNLARLSPQQFVDTYLIPIHVVHAVAGFDFSYGQFGKGSMETMPEHSRDSFVTTTIEKWEQSGEKVSSTRIREAIINGNLIEANELLQRPHEVTGEVVHGDHRGRELGFPTANLNLTANYVLPSTGVYFVKVKVGGHIYPALCNIGYLPTFFEDREEVSIEVYLLSFDGDLYGKTMTVYFYEKLRDDQKFGSVDDLVVQMKDDEQKAINYFKIS